jgi:transcriptional regulator with XRE-family HTH domain
MRIRQRRTLLAMSQTALGTAVGLTFQQIQKYERGANRISSSRLYECAKVLDVPVSFFFDEMTSKAQPGRPTFIPRVKGSGKPEKDPLIKRETLELVRAYYKIGHGASRKRIFEMVKALGAAGYQAPGVPKRKGSS